MLISQLARQQNYTAIPCKFPYILQASEFAFFTFLGDGFYMMPQNTPIYPVDNYKVLCYNT